MTAHTRSRWLGMLVLLCSVACASAACSGTPTGSRPGPWWASVQAPGASQASVFRGIPGSPAYRCVRVGQHRDVRSGGFLAGNFGMGERLFLDASRDHQRYSAIKIYWIPLHVDHMPELTERATLLTGRRMTRTYRQNQVAAAGGSVFYPTAVQIPVPGTWKIAATAGRNKGCFIVIFPRPARSDGSI